jgi:PHD/YefM family antitoxin component YafN of YafNO toxin-antitoxin module
MEHTSPSGSLFNFFEHYPELITSSSCGVQSSVPVEVFKLFVKALETGGKVAVTRENARSTSLLAKGFWLADLLSECSALYTASNPELIADLSERISNLERHISSQPLTILADLKESIVRDERQPARLDCRISALGPNLGEVIT